MRPKTGRQPAVLYRGWLGDQDSHSLSGRDVHVPVVDPSIPPSNFWDQHIRQRKPAIINGHPTDPEWQATARWTDSYLTATAGTALVKVEYRASSKETYGRDKKLNTTFAEVVSRVAAGDASWYLTTQEAAPGSDGHPELWAPPVSLLSGDIPLVPRLMGNLVPQQINMWMGYAPDGSSSGLHHDFHDNLYVVLRGVKRFRLFPPSAAPWMSTQGKLSLVHPNGRIVYRSQGPISADGSHAEEVLAWKERRRAEQKLAAAEAAVHRGEPGSNAQLQAAERELDSILSRALDTDDFDMLHDDFDDLEGAGAAPPPPTASNSQGEPESFSRIDLSLPPAVLKKRFLTFPGLQAAIECEVRAGQCLYLPAGWFHEVTSWGGNTSSNSSKTTKTTGEQQQAGAGHLAVNYWFHPPDNVDTKGDTGYLKPYKSEYWPVLWEGREGRYKKEQDHAQARSSLLNGADVRGNVDKKIDKKVEGSQKRKRKRERAEANDAAKEEEEKNDEEEEEEEERRGEKMPIWGDEREHHSFGGLRAQALRHLRGLFGAGRRQHLHRFIKIRARRGEDAALGGFSDAQFEEY